jgi:hypothetical protein
MSDIVVNVTSAGAANVTVSNGSTVNTTVGNGGAVNVAIGGVSPGNATVVSGTLTINSTTTLSAGTPAYAKNVGTVYAAKLDLGIPAGPATLVTVGNTTTLVAGSNATVTGTANGSNLTLAFGIPAGVAGTNGVNGVTPTLSIGNVTTGAAGSSALVVATASNNGANVLLDFTIPRGDPGTDGANGTNGTAITLSSATPANLGTAAAGTSNLAARADHVHALPVIAYSNLSGVPSNFPTNTTLVSGLSAGYSAINHAHNYVTSLNGITGALTLAAGPNVTISSSNLTLTIDSVGGLGANDPIDGGDYVGQILGGITFATQPTSQTATSNLGAWSNQAAPSNVSLLGVAYAQSGFFALGSGKIARSEDLASWSTSSANLTGINFAGLAYGSNKYVAVGGTVSNGSLVGGSVRYSTDGTNWLGDYYENAGNAEGGFSCVGYANGLFVAGRTSSDGNGYDPSLPFTVYCYTSADGVYWTQRSVGVYYGKHQDVWFGNGVWVLVPRDSLAYANGAFQRVFGRFLKSADGINWSQGTCPATTYLQSGCFGAGLHVLLPSGGNVIYTSTDATTWATRTLPVPSTYSSKVRWCGSQFVMTTGIGTDVVTSKDGVTWSLGSLPTSSSWAEAAGSTTAVLAVSTDNVAATASVVTGTATFAASASVSGGGSVSYQWQLSTDAGATWSNIAGATSSTLSLTGLTTADSGTRYRVAVSATGATTVYSQSAILTVTG